MKLVYWLNLPERLAWLRSDNLPVLAGQTIATILCEQSLSLRLRPAECRGVSTTVTTSTAHLDRPEWPTDKPLWHISLVGSHRQLAAKSRLQRRPLRQGPGPAIRLQVNKPPSMKPPSIASGTTTPRRCRRSHAATMMYTGMPGTRTMVLTKAVM